jgi:hypothetical protein
LLRAGRHANTAFSRLAPNLHRNLRMLQRSVDTVVLCFFALVFGGAVNVLKLRKRARA